MLINNVCLIDCFLLVEMKVKSNSVEDMMSAVREKDESQNRYYKKTKDAKFSEKANISYPPIDFVFLFCPF